MVREIFKWVKPSAIDNLYINHIQSIGNCYFLKDVIISHSDKFLSNIGYGKNHSSKHPKRWND